MEKALKTSESNACMKRIVAAPTAGSCGVVPAVFLSVQEERGFSGGVYGGSPGVAAGIGGVIANRAFSGAAGGCQAEIGFGFRDGGRWCGRIFWAAVQMIVTKRRWR